MVAHIHERIANQRQDFAHKLSRRLVDEFGIIVFEELRIVRMIKCHTPAKSIAVASGTTLRPIRGLQVPVERMSNVTHVVRRTDVAAVKAWASKVCPYVCIRVPSAAWKSIVISIG